MKKFILSSMLVCVAFGLNAEIQAIDGIVYNLRSGAKAWVVDPASNGHSEISYSGELTIPSTVSYGGTDYQVTEIASQCFSNNKEIVQVNLPESLTTIGGSAFMGCSIENIVIPNSVTDIRLSAFSFAMSLKTVTIGSGVTTIGTQAFSGCKAITDVYCLATVPPALSYNVFANEITSGGSATLYVPSEALAAYKDDAKWNVFAKIQPIAGGEVSVTGITLDQESILGVPGDEIQLIATVEPTDATDKTVAWTSSDETVAAVDENGLVRLIKDNSQATITAKCGDFEAICYVEINSKKVGIEGIEAECASAEYYDMQGMRVANPEKGQLVIVRRGGHAFKAVF